MSEPSAGARRAAKGIADECPNWELCIVPEWRLAQIIDSETRCGEMRKALEELDKVLCDHSEITDNNVVYWFDRYCPELDAAVKQARNALNGGPQ